MIIIVVVGIIVIIIVGAIKSSKVSQNLGSASYFKGAEGVQFYIWLEFKMVIIVIIIVVSFPIFIILIHPNRYHFCSRPLYDDHHRLHQRYPIFF